MCHNHVTLKLFLHKHFRSKVSECWVSNKYGTDEGKDSKDTDNHSNVHFRDFVSDVNDSFHVESPLLS